MKNYISTNLKKSLAVTLLLGAFAAVIYAGPGPEFWNRTKPVTTVKEAEAVKPEDTLIMGCKSCKTVMIRDSKHVGPLGKGHEEWFNVGAKHTCTECGGEISVARGKTKDSMQFNCSKCGDGTVSCCVAPAMPEKK